MNCIIRPVPLSEMDVDKSMVTYRLGYGQMAMMVGYVWYIEGLKEKILVDAGVNTEHLRQKKIGGSRARDIQSLESGLNKLGLIPGDIDMVIITHLHADHVAQGRQFSKARFLIQKDELESALNPHPAKT